MNDDLTDDVEKLSLVIDVSYVDYMIMLIGCMSIELYLYL
jgi:hypothetical protein